MRRAGVAETIEAGRRTPESIRAAALSVLGDPSYRRNAARVRDQIADLPGPEHAATLLVRLATEKQPIRAF
jgi:UDP:flavonoid glycosyltransferase YjiC (YdhE family)